jgi:ribosomal protein S18 acetylase RimI-like enzyme
MRIEAASSADADTLAGLNEYVQNLHLENAPQFFKSPTRERATDAFKALLDRDDARAFIAYSDGRAIGYVLVFLIDRPETVFASARRGLYLDQISVEPNSRRQGVGRALLNAALGYASATGIDEIEVETWSFNVVAQAFFKSAGFGPKTERLWLKPRA